MQIGLGGEGPGGKAGKSCCCRQSEERQRQVRAAHLRLKSVVLYTGLAQKTAFVQLILTSFHANDCNKYSLQSRSSPSKPPTQAAKCRSLLSLN